MKKHRLVFLIFPAVLFAIGAFSALRATSRGVEIYPLIASYFLIMIGVVTAIFVVMFALARPRREGRTSN